MSIGKIAFKIREWYRLQRGVGVIVYANKVDHIHERRIWFWKDSFPFM